MKRGSQLSTSTISVPPNCSHDVISRFMLPPATLDYSLTNTEPKEAPLPFIVFLLSICPQWQEMWQVCLVERIAKGKGAGSETDLWCSRSRLPRQTLLLPRNVWNVVLGTHSWNSLQAEAALLACNFSSEVLSEDCCSMVPSQKGQHGRALSVCLLVPQHSSFQLL